jgi:ABC-type multidrug transport system ATPase subunit
MYGVAKMIEANGLTKTYGTKTAVSDLSFVVRPGIVTGFLGPNGSGKSTTMRLILGLDAPTSGDSLVNGKRYREHGRSTPDDPLAITCSRLPPFTASVPAGSIRYSSWLG